MHYAVRRFDGWYVHYEDGGDGYLTPVAGPLTKAAAERYVRLAQPPVWEGLVVVSDTYIGPT